MAADEIAAELIEQDRITRPTQELLWNDGHAKLEATADEFRRLNARTAAGNWKLGLFYAGLRDAFLSCAISCEGLVEDWIDAYPGSGTARIAYADLLIYRAWELRGSSYANEVKHEAWQPFYDKIAEARVYLERFKLIASNDPHWYQLMLTIAKVQDWPADEFIALLEEGLHRSSLYYPLYFAGVEYFLPKWHGSSAALEKFARWAAARTRSAEGMTMYARVYWYAFNNQYYEDLFTDSDVVWTDMSAGFDDLLKAYPDQWNVNNFAYFACLAGDRAKALDLMKRIENGPALAIWRTYENYNRCLRWAHQSAG